MGDDLEIVATPWYDAELSALPDPAQARVETQLERLRERTWESAITDQRIKRLQHGIYELRILGHGAAYRVLFFVAPGRSPRMLVLTTCVAKSMMKKRHRLDTEIHRAVDRRAWWLEQQKQKEDNDGQV
jgi:phage-related protein